MESAPSSISQSANAKIAFSGACRRMAYWKGVQMAADPARSADLERKVRPAPAFAFGRARQPIPAEATGDLTTASMRRIGALVALLAGGIATVALAAALLDPGKAALPLLIAALALTGGTIAALLLRLQRERASAARLATRLEAYADANWELEEAGAGIPTGDAASGFEPALSIATVSHELRAPLHGMKGLADLLAETELTAEQRSYVDAIGQSTAALGRVVDDLLDASRIATGHFSLDETPTAIEPLVEQVAELMAPRAFAKGLGLATQLPVALPEADLDAGRLRQVLINLVANAISFSDGGGVVLAVETVDRGEIGCGLRFSVSDTGRGVAPEDRSRIFDSFERSPDGGGAGLGLAISSRILERMGARLSLASRKGGGSIFAFELPVAAPAARPAPTLGDRRVLVAMRSEPERSALAAGIAAEGGEAASAATLVAAAGLLGAAAAAGERFDAVLIDAHLIGEAEAAPQMLRLAAGRELPLVALIEPGERERLSELHAAGLDAYLVRPIRRSSLKRVLSRLTEPGREFIIDPTDIPDEVPLAGLQRPVRTLVVEDDPVSALLIRAVLEKLGHEVAEANSGAAARQALARREPDLVLVDLNLGSEGGAELLREFAAAGKRAAVIAMSADDQALGAVTQDADVTLSKPVSPESLRRAVAAAVGAGAA